ncbi:BQ5605_C002g01021 [Microbotryum silenes-dioicae]|uniref:BQ5605_C002g01021 protein n=1 Tax=Microbotryum silenes-dioicae TaxID=796604 RepID=A0A2X0M1F1_9BASI|nr:BQ5605_C002g01021 [Microbotryum silenes-dioicae]
MGPAVRTVAPARDKVVEILLSAPLDRDMDCDFLEEELIPRIVMCDTSDLMYSVFGIERALFKERAQNRDCRRSANQTKADWVVPLASFATAGGRQEKLTLAHAQQRTRWACDEESEETGVHHFFTCCERMASENHSSAGQRMLVPIHFGVTPHAEASDDCTPSPFVRVAFDMAQHALEQPARLFVPGLAITGTTAHLVVIDHEVCRIVTISDCWGEGFGELAVIVAVLSGLDVYSAGLCPFFRYECAGNIGFKAVSLVTWYLRPPELEDDVPLVARTVEFIDEEPVELLSCAVRRGGSNFSRSTAVFQLARPSLMGPNTSSESDPPHSFVLKIQYTRHECVGHEANVLRMIDERCNAASPEVSSLIFSHINRLEQAKSFDFHCSQMNDSDFSLVQGKDSHRRVRRRKLDLVILRNPTPLPTQVDCGQDRSRPVGEAYQVFDQLLTLLPILYDLGIHHRDLSPGNILHHRGQLVLVDWDTGIVAPPGELVPICATDGTGSVRATLATTPFDVLAWLFLQERTKLPMHMLANDLESATYWFVIVLGSFRVQSWETAAWRAWKVLDLPPGNPPYVRALVHARLELWGNSGESQCRRIALLEALRDLCPAEGQVVDIFTRNFPAWREIPNVHQLTKERMATMQARMRDILALQPRCE